jgi:hypothetical protein
VKPFDRRAGSLICQEFALLHRDHSSSGPRADADWVGADDRVINPSFAFPGRMLQIPILIPRFLCLPSSPRPMCERPNSGQCPLQGCFACTAIDRPNSCCGDGTFCHIIQHTTRGDVRCCWNGDVCGDALNQRVRLLDSHCRPHPQTTSISTHSRPSTACDPGCTTGCYACRAYYYGGCCQTTVDCHSTSYPPIASAALLTNERTIVAPCRHRHCHELSASQGNVSARADHMSRVRWR